MSSLNSRALLINLSINQWQANKLDKRASDALVVNAGAVMGAGRVNKTLLPSCQTLADVKRCAGVVRQRYYDSTLPWSSNGTRIIPAVNYQPFMDWFRLARDEWLFSIVPAFLDEYDTARNTARHQLGALFSADDYPDKTKVRRAFDMSIETFNVESDFRVELSDDELRRMAREQEERIQSAVSNAMRDAWQRLYDKVKHAAEKLSDPTAIFRDSLIENIQTTCETLTRLNLTDDPNLEAMRQEVEALLAAQSPDALRTDMTLRQDTADAAVDIAQRMSDFMSAL